MKTVLALTLLAILALPVAAAAADADVDTDPSLRRRPTDRLSREDRVGITTMVYYTNRDGDQTVKDKGGEFRFDSFRFWGQTEITDDLTASAQYRLYEGWQTPHHVWLGYQTENSYLELGQTWVPFGIRWSTYDDWGNVIFYTGFEDDHDYGLAWGYAPGDVFLLALGFFKNQQLASDSRQRYDADVFSGAPNDADPNTGVIRKANQETNQFNARVAWNFPLGEGNLELGASGLAGQLYNLDTREMGSRLAFGAHANLSSGRWQGFLQGVSYDFTQKLPDTAPAGADRFLNMSSWDIAYEMPSQANMLAAGVAYDIKGEKLTLHTNYSVLSGGTSEADSWIWTAGLRSFWEVVDIFLEGYYGHNDPQLSGRASGYGRDDDFTDFRVDLRFVYRMSLVKESQPDDRHWKWD